MLLRLGKRTISRAKAENVLCLGINVANTLVYILNFAAAIIKSVDDASLGETIQSIYCG